jgi:hypothetical protein
MGILENILDAFATQSSRKREWHLRIKIIARCLSKISPKAPKLPTDRSRWLKCNYQQGKAHPLGPVNSIKNQIK